MDREKGCVRLTNDRFEDFMRDLSSGLILGESVWVVQGIVCFFVSITALSKNPIVLVRQTYSRLVCHFGIGMRQKRP